MLKYFISIFIFLLGATAFSQEKPLPEKKVKATIKKDSITYKTAYGFRLGVDISKPIIGAIDENYSGLELIGDYRIKKNLYIAAELGYEEKRIEEDFTTSSSVGSFLRLGINQNLYKNWLDMNNEIYVGARYGFAIFEQTLIDYTPNITDETYPQYFAETTDPIIANETTTGLSIHWFEIQLGAKVETFKNLFVGFSTSFKVAVSIKNPDNFATLYAPGFNTIYSSKTGFGFNYTISYLIPFKKK